MLFVSTPGADWAYAITSGLRQRSGMLPGVSGMLAGHLTATFIVAAGVAALLAASNTAMTILTAAGAAYLIWLGISALRHPAVPDLQSESVPFGQGHLFAKGIGISLLNPKVFLLFLALLPGFANPNAPWPVGVQMIVLGILHVISCGVVYFAIGYGAAAILTRKPHAAKLVGILSGIVMILLGLALIIEKLAAIFD